MVDILLSDWLEEYNSLSESEIRSYASEQEHNNEVVIALYTVFDEHVKYSKLINQVCNQLFCFYRSGEEVLQRFTLQFIPALVLLYLENVNLTHGDRQVCHSVETLLIGIYNLEIIDKSGQPKVLSFRIPSIAQASIYHEPSSLGPAFLTETCLRRWEECNSKLVNWGPLPQVEFLNAQNRLRVVTALVFIYNRQLGRLSNTSLEHLCKVSSKLVSQGFHSSGAHVRLSVDSDSSHTSNLTPRIALSSQLLLEFLHALHYALFDGNVMSATQALEDVYNRACYESYTDVLLVANSIKNLLLISRSGISDGIMNMNLVHSTTTTTPAPVSKSMITNASFRTKKLPDDIGKLSKRVEPLPGYFSINSDYVSYQPLSLTALPSNLTNNPPPNHKPRKPTKTDIQLHVATLQRLERDMCDDEVPRLPPMLKASLDMETKKKHGVKQECTFPILTSKKGKSSSKINASKSTTSLVDSNKSEHELHRKRSAKITFKSNISMAKAPSIPQTISTQKTKIKFCCLKKHKVKEIQSSSVSSNESDQKNS